MNKTGLIVLFLAAVSLNAGSIEIQPESVRIPSRLVGASLSFEEGSFYVHKEGHHAKVENYNLTSTIRDISSKDLEAFLRHGYLMVNTNDLDEYTVKESIRVLGGGLLSSLGRSIKDPIGGTIEFISGLLILDKPIIENSVKRLLSAGVTTTAILGGGFIGIISGEEGLAEGITGVRNNIAEGMEGGAEISERFDKLLTIKR